MTLAIIEQRRIKVADEIKFANQLTLKREHSLNFPGGFSGITGSFIVEEGKTRVSVSDAM